jgi:hypothetical protein
VADRDHTSDQHLAVVTIGKERMFRIGSLGPFGSDDLNNVLTCAEEVTRLRPSGILQIPRPPLLLTWLSNSDDFHSDVARLPCLFRGDRRQVAAQRQGQTCTVT